MNRKEEKEYFNLLERIIREEKKNSFFFKEDSDSHFMDIQMLLKRIYDKNPDIIEKLFNNYIDATQLKDKDKIKNIADFTASLDKGSIVRWKNKDGTELYYLNQGSDLITGKKKLILFSNILSGEDINLLKKTMIGKVLEKDVKQIYKKIHNETKEKQLKKPSLFNEISNFKEDYSRAQLDSISDGFEKHFKKMLKEVGSPSTDEKVVAAVMLRQMSPGEKRDFNTAFSNYTQDGFKALLKKWKNETFHKSVSASQSGKLPQRNITRKRNNYIRNR